MIMNNALAMSREYAGRAVSPGDTAVDATAGKGRDTLLLSKLAGEQGKVYAFDIQEEALGMTRALLDSEGRDNAVLILDDHENIDQYVGGGIACVMFNLGYLPGSDHSVHTKAGTTTMAIGKTLGLLKRHGIITIVIYHGGDSGYEERDAVLLYCSALDQDNFSVMKVSFENQKNDPPIFILIEKL